MSQRKYLPHLAAGTARKNKLDTRQRKELPCGEVRPIFPCHMVSSSRQITLGIPNTENVLDNTKTLF